MQLFYFYPYPVGAEQFNDEAAYLQYGAGYSNKGDWRRGNVNAFVEQLYMEIKAEKPSVQFGISPFGKWIDYIAPQIYWSTEMAAA